MNCYYDTLPLPEVLDGQIEALLATYPALARRTLGKSILGREIPLLLLGRGRRKHLYVATHHAAEWLTTCLLLHFVEEVCEAAAAGSRPYGLDVAFLLSQRTLCFVPMLNPDGVAIHGGVCDDILAERRAAMRGEEGSVWQANARGVDLNHNYAVGFAEYKKIERGQGLLGGAPTKYSGEAAESEPESAALASFTRTVMPSLVLSLHTQGEEILWRGGGVEVPGAHACALRMSSLSGYRLAIPEGSAAYGGFCDYTAAALGIPSFTVECGRGQNPLPIGDGPHIYARLRRMLFESIAM